PCPGTGPPCATRPHSAAASWPASWTAPRSPSTPDPTPARATSGGTCGGWAGWPRNSCCADSTEGARAGPVLVDHARALRPLAPHHLHQHLEGQAGVLLEDRAHLPGREQATGGILLGRDVRGA